GIRQASNSAADCKGDKQMTGSAANSFYQRLASFGGGGNVEHDDLICSRLGMKLRQFGGIAGIAKLLELHSFDHTSGVHIEAGNDALGQQLRGRRSFQES